MTDLMTIREAAEYFGAAEGTIRYWIEKGLLVKVVDGKGTKSISRKSAENLKAQYNDIAVQEQAITAYKQELQVERDSLKREIHETKAERGFTLQNIDFISELLTTISDSVPSYSLTRREQEILQAIIKGKTYREIGTVLNLTSNRVQQIAKRSLREIAIACKYYHTLIQENDTLKEQIKTLQTALNTANGKLKELFIEETVIESQPLFLMRLENMDLSVRTLHYMQALEITTLGQLVAYKRSDLLKVRNFGKKSITELDELLEKHGLTWRNL